ncbi:MATE family efflux transporter [Litchfieldia salsa]|uniref:Putative efflux protein, MATE family n=1 Tax=Litchfieldia salsa TaxID=930152 RepID=A0A1H0UPW0_9BACI|nr:MATE family efflux transporter [Litchfieldia salsa]SDP68140.1 putative efflux protein, MATE family [Litchfieldia salsa]
MKTREYPVQKLTLFAITWPIFIETMLHLLMGNADTLMLSQYSDDAVAAVGVSNQVLMLIGVLFGFIATGTSVLVSRSLGANSFKEASQIAVVSIVSNILVGLVIGVALVFFASDIISMMGVSSNLNSEATVYLQIVGGCLFLQSGIMTMGAILRSYRFTRDAMYVTLAMNVINIIGNYLFIFGMFGLPVLGVTGVAISTILSRFIGLAIIIIILYKRIKPTLPFSYVLKRFPHIELKRLLKIGVPSAGEHLSFNGSQLVITSFIVMLGTEAITTKVYAQNIGMFVLLFSIAIGQGNQIIIGHQIGAKQFDAAYKRCIDSLLIAIGLTSIVGLIIYLFSKPILTLFTANENIIATGSILLLLTALVEPGRSFNAVVITSLRAAGDVNFPVFIGILSMWGVSVPLAYILGIHFELGLVGVWIAFMVDEWLRGGLMLWRWRQGKWRQMTISRKVQSSVS